MSSKPLTTKSSWEAYFKDVGLRDELVEEYGLYAAKLLENSLPVIFDWHHLASLLGVSVEFVASVHSASAYHYREFRVPKRSGGHRVIQAPRAALKECQRWILNSILYKFKVHAAAKGFVRKRSVREHAKIHIGMHPTLKMDFKDFFPSIAKRRVISLFRSMGYSDSVSLYLASFCCLGERLPQGAPTSPTLSNLVCRALDGRLTALAKKNKWVYSRYADDLAVSGRGVRFDSSRILSIISEDEGFLINHEKTRFYPIGSRRVITGVVVGEKSLSIPREYKRNLSQQIYYVGKYGVLSHIAKTRIREPDFLSHLSGRLEFWLFVEPASKRAIRLKRILTETISAAVG